MAVPYPRTRIRTSSRAALADVTFEPFWLDRAIRPAPRPALVGSHRADLVVVGGGFTGLWTALLALERDPGREVVVLEADRIAEGASGRNGGFMAASITHGFANGLARWPGEIAELTRLGELNLAQIQSTIRRYDMRVDLARTGELDVATEPHHPAMLAESVAAARTHGLDLELLDRDQTRALVDSPLYRGGVLDRDGVVLVDPAQLAWELARVVRQLGGHLHEHTRAQSLESTGKRLTVHTEHGSIAADRVALATSAFPSLLRRVRPYVIPVYDYALVTEPLTPEQWARVGWQFGGGIGDTNNQFHYTRPTADGRILWGGFDAIYHAGSAMGPHLNRDDHTFALLAEHFFLTFPQLSGLRFTHAWGGAIDTCTRFSAFWGTAKKGRVAYSLGYTGLGVGASRFGAAVMLDLLADRDTERTRPEMVRTRPHPFPPEPLRSSAVAITRWSLDRADHAEGRRNLWLRTLDRVGMGFDS